MDEIRGSECLLDKEKAADIEVAIQLIRSINGQIESVKAHGNGNSIRSCVEMAENFMGTMKNPFTKKLLVAKIAELKAIHDIP